MRARVPALFLLKVCLSFGSTFHARAIDDNQLLTSVDAFTRLVVPMAKGAPFSAQIRAEWVGPIPGPGQVVRSNTASVLRDSAGRVRQEQWTWARSNGSTQPPELLYVTIMDPVKALGATCFTKEHVCSIRPLDVAHIVGTSCIASDRQAWWVVNRQPVQRTRGSRNKRNGRCHHDRLQGYANTYRTRRSQPSRSASSSAYSLVFPGLGF